ncbi:MAG: VWA domain-containing protein [Cyanobacteria bacterium P01_A01_bin.83]
MTNNCKAIAPGKSLNSWQQLGLNLASRIYGGRDVVIAIDLTESVGLNAEGRLRLTQIIEDSLQSGDTVYLVPFAARVNPLQPEINPLSFSTGIKFKRKPEVINQILDILPFESGINLRNTDIQRAELFAYQGLAQLNQCRLNNNLAPKPQSVIWLTDAPLLTKPGIDSATWIETPSSSPFRRENSQASKERASWLLALPIKERSQIITTDNNRTYELAVVDIPPTVQEFCTPAPGGKETCLVTPYLLKLLLFPTLFLIIVLGLVGWGSKRVISLNKRWRVKVRYVSDDDLEAKSCYLKHKQKITIGDNSTKGIFCPGDDIRGYLIRRGNKIYLKPTNNGALLYGDRLVEKEVEITRNSIRINCPFEDKKRQDFEIELKVSR